MNKFTSKIHKGLKRSVILFLIASLMMPFPVGIETAEARTIRLFSSVKIYNGRVVVHSTENSASSLVLVDSAQSSATTITIPATAQAGDVAILFDVAINPTLNATPPTDVVPTGWTGIITESGSITRARISRKILAAGEPGSSITGMNGLSSDDKVMLVFRNTSAITAVSAEDWAVEITTGNPASQTVNASGQTAPLIVFGMAFISGGTGAFSTQSPSFDATITGADEDILLGYKIYESSPANHTVDMNDLGNINVLASGFLEVQ
jgi:hypothetical protein